MEYCRKGALRVSDVVASILSRIHELVVISLLAVYYGVETLILTLTPSSLRRGKDLKDKIVLVTGGAGGVGRELVLKLAKSGAKVVVWDNNEKAMEKFNDALSREDITVRFYPVDITDRKIVYKYADQMREEVGDVDVLINNAGIVCGQTFLDIPDYMIEKTYKVNVLSHYWLAKAFLPNMLKKKAGHIVTVGSLTGLVGTYKCTDYSGSKFATVGFHESLHCELKTHGHDYIKMTLICPYFIDTGMFDGCKPKRYKMLSPKDVADRIITSIEREEVFLTIPTFSRFAASLKYWIPAKLGWELMHRVVKGPQSMMGLRPFQEVEAA